MEEEKLRAEGQCLRINSVGNKNERFDFPLQ